MSSDNDEFSLEGLDDLDIHDNEDGLELSAAREDDGFELDLSVSDDGDLSLSADGEAVENISIEDADEFSLTGINLNISLADNSAIKQTLDVSSPDEIDLGDEAEEDFHVQGSEDSLTSPLKVSDKISAPPLQDEILGLSDEDLFAVSEDDDSESVAEDVKAKLKEIDAIMEEDATNAAFSLSNEALKDDLFSTGFAGEESLDLSESSEEDFSLEEENFDDPNESLVGDLDLAGFNLEEIDQSTSVKTDDNEVIAASPSLEKKSKREDNQQSLSDISQAYTGEMQRTQATISNLRSDRDELLTRIDSLEEEKLINHRNQLTQRAELDEKKIELTIIRKKLNDEINDLKDRVRVFEEKVLILEEKNKHLYQELDKAGQKNKIDIKKVILRERELEQKLELLKADAETQIRNRDLKILELKRKIDGMEFDMESMNQQEKKTLESRFELEDKLDKAIRTLRTAISSLEDDGQRSSTIDAIKKNIDM